MSFDIRPNHHFDHPDWVSTNFRLYNLYNLKKVRDQSLCDSLKGKNDVIVASDKLLDRSSSLSFEVKELLKVQCGIFIGLSQLAKYALLKA